MENLTQPNQSKPNQTNREKEKKECMLFLFYLQLDMIWCEVKAEDACFFLEATIFILNKFLATINFKAIGKKEANKKEIGQPELIVILQIRQTY